MAGTAEENVVVRNVYYMMAYAFKSLNLLEYAKLANEDFDHLGDLLAAILALGIGVQRKRGFERGYLEVSEDLLGVRGRIDIQGTSRNRVVKRREICCVYDEYSEDTYMNRILKCCAGILLRDPVVDAARKADLKRCLLYLESVSTIDPLRIEWNRLRFHRNNRSYQLLMNVCHMVVEGWLLGTEQGEAKLAHYADSQKLHALYENFVLAYYQEEHPELHASSKTVSSGSDDAPSFLPAMYTDVTLECGDRTLIIDCKCYGQIMHNNMGHEILSPAHRNQVYGYVMHEAYDRPERNIDGMLLYALTESEAAVHESWVETGHGFHCFTLDLGKDFKEIARQLDEIAELVTKQAGAN